MRKIRLIVAVLLLLLSLAVLAWATLPVRREEKILRVSPSEMTIPTPSALAPWGVQTI